MAQQLVLLFATVLMPILSTVNDGALRQLTHCTLRASGELGDPDNHHPQNWEQTLWMWRDG